MAHSYNRYESGMMLPPVTDGQKWLEAQRIMADMIDDHPKNVTEDEGMMCALRADGIWVKENGEEKDFTLTRYVTYADGEMETVYALRCAEGKDARIYYIDTSQRVDVVRDNDVLGPLEKRRAEVYDILASVALRGFSDDTHYQFENIVMTKASQEVPLQITGTLMNLKPEEWDELVAERQKMFQEHARSRINPIYLTPVAFNLRYQGQLEAAPPESS